MVGFLHSPSIKGAAEQEKEDLKSQSLSDSQELSKPNDPLHLCLPELEDFSSSFSDSFLDFDSINGWFIEGNTGLCSDPNMADLGGNPVDFGSGKCELGASKEVFEVGGDWICKKDEVAEELSGKEESSWGLGLEKGESGVDERSIEMGSQAVPEKINIEGVSSGDGFGQRLGDLGCLIETQLGKVSLDGESNCLVPVFASENGENVGGDMSVVNGGDCWKSSETVYTHGNGATSGGVDCTHAGDVVGVNGNGIKSSETVNDEDESDSDVECEGKSPSASSSSSSSSSSSDEDEDEEEEEGGDEDSVAMTGEKTAKKGHIDIEEGEIMLSDADQMVGWSDNEDADDGGGNGTVGPITSKNELKVLPPVPSVTVTLQPHHQTLPVGIILSIIGPQVIVEGVEKHNPLNEGSILWITESRSPLGIVDEIFGPVKNPYYVVRYNSESEVPPGIQQGTLISFVPEFADHVLNDKSLYQKGYDASGENDEELSDGMEFSDDEKEAEYKRMLKMKKRGTSESKPGTKRNEKRQQNNQTGKWNRSRDPAAKAPLHRDKLPVTVTEDQCLAPAVATSLNQDNYSCSSGLRQDLAAGVRPIVPPFPHRGQAPGFYAPNGIWSNGFAHQQHQSIGFPSGLPANGMLWMQQSQPYQLYQTPLQSGVTLQQQISTFPGLPFNFNALGGQSNFGGGPALAPWPTGLDQNVLNTSQFGMSLQAQHPSLPLNAEGEPAVQSHGSQITHNLQPSPTTSERPLNFNQGSSDRGGRRGYHRGRGRHGGGRGRYGSR